MKLPSAVIGLVLGSVLPSLSGCQSQNETPPAGRASNTTNSHAEDAEPATEPVVEDTEPTAQRISSLPLPRRRVGRKELEAAIQRSGNYLASHCDEDGRFQYLAHPDPRIDTGRDYNLLRHIGAIYGLARLEQFAPTPVVREAISRSSSFLFDQAVRPIPEEEEGMLAVWSDPELTGQVRPQAKLGGAALAVIALDACRSFQPVDVEQLKKLGQFLLWMQKPDGSFFSIYDPTIDWRELRFESQFYPGEATFALILLHQIDPDGPWRKAASASMRALARKQAGRLISTPDQWALLAGRPFLQAVEKEPALRQLAIDHLARTASDMLHDQRAALADPRTAGCYTVDGQTCPTATRLEGLLAAIHYLPDSHRSLRREAILSVELGMSFLLGSQIRRGPLSGGFPCVTAALSPDDPRLSGIEATQVEAIRIDYVQHALSAMLSYHELMKSGDLPGLDK